MQPVQHRARKFATFAGRIRAWANRKLGAIGNDWGGNDEPELVAPSMVQADTEFLPDNVGAFLQVDNLHANGHIRTGTPVPARA